MSHIAPPPVPVSERPCRISEWRPFDGGGSLIGKATVQFRNGLVVAGVPVFRRGDGSLSVGTPDAPLVDADGQQLRDADGKRRYAKVISFATQDGRERWNRTILGALADAGIGVVP
jgi:hypothetical protein